jgi:carbon-monoxide dehydrogenase medium subunit
MKPPVFEYHRPGTVAEALAVLAEVGHDGKVLAGGQSLVPLLNMRLAAPRHLVDVNWLAELDEVGCGPDAVRVGALARHARVEHDRAATDAVPLLGQAIADIAHATVRNRARWSAAWSTPTRRPSCRRCWSCWAGTMELARAGDGGRREVAAADFFVGPLESALRPRGAGHRGHLSRGRRPAPAAPGWSWPGATATTPCAGSGRWSSSTRGCGSCRPGRP